MLLQMKETQQPCSLGWGFRWVKGRVGSGSRPLGMGFWVGKGLSWLRVKAFGVWNSGLGWVRGRFGSELRYVGLRMGFRVGEGSIWLRVKAWGLRMGFCISVHSIWLRVKAYGAWDGVLCG
jgi:hypothetical protein